MDTVKDEKEAERVQQMKTFIQDYLATRKATKKVTDFLVKAETDTELLLRFLRGRKQRPKHAWETILKYSETRFNTYPEVFPDGNSTCLEKLNLPEYQNNPLLGILKSRDNNGRRVMFFSSRDWNPDEYSLQDLTLASVCKIEKLLLEEDVLQNGIVYIQDCSGVGLKQARQYTFHSMRRLTNVFWQSYPISIREIYFVNVPNLLKYIFSMFVPLLPKKLRDTLVISPASIGFEEVHRHISPSILPQSFDGVLETSAAVDMRFLEF